MKKSKFKKIGLKITAFLVVVATLTACAQISLPKDTLPFNKIGNNKKMYIGYVADDGGLKDKGFNEKALEGIQSKANQLDAKLKVVESRSEQDYGYNIESTIESGCNLIIATGFKMKDTMAAEALQKKNKDIKFVLIDCDLGEDIPENLQCASFKENEATYLAGIISAATSKTGKIGFIGGQDNEVINRFRVGYEYGAKRFSKNTDIEVVFANSFSDIEKGRVISKDMYDSGVDVIFAAAGNVGNGLIEEAIKENKMMVGVDKDQNDLAPDNMLTSVVKNVDKAAEIAIDSVHNGDFQGGKTLFYGLAQEGMDIAQTTLEGNSKLVPDDVLKLVLSEREKVKSGERTIPATEEELQAALENEVNEPDLKDSL